MTRIYGPIFVFQGRIIFVSCCDPTDSLCQEMALETALVHVLTGYAPGELYFMASRDEMFSFP